MILVRLAENWLKVPAQTERDRDIISSVELFRIQIFLNVASVLPLEIWLKGSCSARKDHNTLSSVDFTSALVLARDLVKGVPAQP
jgi:hypothetical protein